MKKNYLLLLLSVFSLSAAAQLQGDGFYRVLNMKTSRYINVIDNKGSVDVASTQADLGAIQTVKGFDNVVDDPGSIIYIRKMGAEYDLVAQGTSVHDIVGITVQLLEFGGGAYYRAYKAANGVARYLFDLDNVNREVGKVLTTGQLNSGTANWYVLPVSDADERYLAVKPTLQVDNYFYQTVYASYGFSLNNTNDRAYYISRIDGEVAVLKEVVGTVPPATPVIIRANSNVVSDHKLTPFFTTPTAVTGNLLTGTYFCSSVAGHVNRVAKDATIRVLGQLSDGSLGFKMMTEDYVPHNSAYLKVASNAPAEIKLMTEDEYAAWKEQERLRTPVTLTAVNLTRVYGEENPELTFTVNGTLLGGSPVLSCEATATSPAGTYPIVIAKGDVVNLSPTLVNGTLTITKAPVTVTTGEYKREYGEANPEFEFSFEGFKNNDTYYSLSMRPVATTTATATSMVGDYDITISGAEARNYDFIYVPGKLTITKAPLTISAGNYQREEGQENPTVVPTFEGFKNHETSAVLTKQPTITIQADKDSPAGTYDIVVSNAQSPNYRFIYVNGTLEITKPDAILDITSLEEADAYTLRGTRAGQISQNGKTLRKGIYVIRGKKIVVR